MFRPVSHFLDSGPGGLLHLLHGLGGRAGVADRLAAGGTAGAPLLLGQLLPHFRRHHTAGLILNQPSGLALALVLDLIVWFSLLCFGHGIASFIKNRTRPARGASRSNYLFKTSLIPAMI